MFKFANNTTRMIRCTVDNDWWVSKTTDLISDSIISPKNPCALGETLPDYLIGNCIDCKYSIACHKMSTKCNNCDYKFICVIYLDY